MITYPHGYTAINNCYPQRLISHLPAKTIIQCGCLLIVEAAIMEARIARAINRLSEDGTDLLSGLVYVSGVSRGVLRVFAHPPWAQRHTIN